MTFLISRKSKDFNRLKDDGFNVKAIESAGLNVVMGNADFILFSKNLGTGSNINVLLQRYRNKTIFLGHGVSSKIYDDGSYLRNTIGNWAKYVLCTSKWEKEILDGYSHGKFKTLMFGFPRHDVLLYKYSQLDLESKPKQVFISFHWRVGGSMDFS